MDHSCAPNAVWISKGKELIIKCISEENIENISDLRISYIPNLYESTERRRDLLMEDYYFECQCSRLDNFQDSNFRLHIHTLPVLGYFFQNFNMYMIGDYFNFFLHF